MKRRSSGRACLVLALAAGPGAAWAADWRMHIASAQAVVMVDAATLTRDGPTRTFRTVIYTGRPDEHGVVGYVATLRLDCAHRTSQTTELTDLQADGSASPNTEEKSGAETVGPDSYLSVVYERVCPPAGGSNDTGGVVVGVAPDVAARSVFGLLELGLTSEQASELASYEYQNAAAMETALDNLRIGKAKLVGAKRLAVRKVLAAQVVAAPTPPPPIVPLRAAVQSGWVGRYSASAHEMAAGIWLKADGTFEYGLTVGSLDEAAKGRWTASGRRIHLVNEPRPVPPAITAGSAQRDPNTGLSLHLVTPDGRGVRGVDFVLGFDDGTVLDGDTQPSGWRLPADEKRAPRWVQFSMAADGLTSPRFDVELGTANVLTFVLTPNDISQVDFTDLAVEADRNGLVIHRRGGDMRFRK